SGIRAHETDRPRGLRRILRQRLTKKQMPGKWICTVGMRGPPAFEPRPHYRAKAARQRRHKWTRVNQPQQPVREQRVEPDPPCARIKCLPPIFDLRCGIVHCKKRPPLLLGPAGEYQQAASTREQSLSGAF